MTKQIIPRVVIAGTASGVGKTTLVTGLLAFWRQQEMDVQSYKVGPDYIDGGFHQLASGKAAYNLDSWLMPTQDMVSLFIKTATGHDLAIIEGVMGLFDGGGQGLSSTAAIAKQLAAPVILVIDAKAAAESVAALALGFKQYDPEVNLAGVIVNNLGSVAHQEMVASALAGLNIRLLGCLFRYPALNIPERHLGLTPVAEWEDRGQIQLLATQVGQQVKCEELHQIARSAPPMEQTAAPVAPLEKCVRIGVAQDKSFSFYYPESLAVLEALGAQLVPFSPLADKDLPQVDGLVFGGGFPEMFLSQLAANGDMQAAIRRVAAQGMPIYAECGGMMYLARQLITTAGQSYPMVGLVPGVCQMQAKLQAVGYVEATALGDNILCYQGDKLHGHEFHFSTLLPDEDNLADEAFQFITVNNADCYLGGYFTSNLLASYLHIHFAGNKQAAQRLIQLCSNYRTKGS